MAKLKWIFLAMFLASTIIYGLIWMPDEPFSVLNHIVYILFAICMLGLFFVGISQTMNKRHEAMKLPFHKSVFIALALLFVGLGWGGVLVGGIGFLALVLAAVIQ